MNGTLDEVATALGVDRSAISKIESGKHQRPPTRQRIELIAEALDVPAMPLLIAAGYVISIGTDELDDDDAAIMESIRELPADEKARLRRMIEGGYGRP